MFTVGINVAKRSHEACVLDAFGHTVGHPLKFSSSRTGADELAMTLRELGGSATIALEASGHYWQGLYHHLVARGFHVTFHSPCSS